MAPIRRPFVVDNAGQMAALRGSCTVATQGMRLEKRKRKLIGTVAVMLKEPVAVVVVGMTTPGLRNEPEQVSSTGAPTTGVPGQLPLWVQQTCPVTVTGR